MPFPLRLIEADLRLKSDVDGVNQALVEDSAIVSLWAFCCWHHLLGYSLSEMGRVGENVLDYGGRAGGKRGVLPSATPSTILHPPPTPAAWADVGKFIRDSNVFRQEASFQAERCIFNGDRKRDAAHGISQDQIWCLRHVRISHSSSCKYASNVVWCSWLKMNMPPNRIFLFDCEMSLLPEMEDKSSVFGEQQKKNK